MEAAVDNELPRTCSRTDGAAQPNVKMKQSAFLCCISEKEIVSTATTQLLLLVLLANRHAKLQHLCIRDKQRWQNDPIGG